MATLNTVRAVLVAGAVVAALLAAVYGQWLTVLILVAGIAGHAALWVYLHRLGLLNTKSAATSENATPPR